MKIVQGDLLDLVEFGDLQAAAHCSNCHRGHFGPKIAAKVKEKFPQVYQADLDFITQDKKERLGKFTYAEISKGKWFYSLYGQLDYSNYKRSLNYEAIYRTFEGMAADCKSKGLTKIGFPAKIGADRAKGNSVIIHCMISEVFKGFDVTLVEFVA